MAESDPLLLLPTAGSPPPAAAPTGAKERIDTDAITGLRGFASMHILLGHLLLMGKITWSPMTDEQVDLLGGVSVSLFFLLSGFIIAIAYGRRDMSTPEKQKAFRSEFYKKRFARLLPMYYFGIALCVYFMLAVMEDMGEGFVWFNFVASLFFLTPWYGSGPINGPLWQLASMIWIFLLFPYILPRLQRITERFRAYCVFYILQLVLFVGLLFSPFGYQMARGIPFRVVPVFCMGYVMGTLRMDYPTAAATQHHQNICCSVFECSCCCCKCCACLRCLNPVTTNSRWYADGLTIFVCIAMFLGSLAGAFVMGVGRLILEPTLIYIQGLLLFALTIPEAKHSLIYRACTLPMMMWLGEIGLSVYALQDPVARYVALIGWGYDGAQLFDIEDDEAGIPSWSIVICFFATIVFGKISHELIETKFNTRLIAWLLKGSEDKQPQGKPINSE